MYMDWDSRDVGCGRDFGFRVLSCWGVRLPFRAVQAALRMEVCEEMVGDCLRILGHSYAS